jgi:hypothetical protein
MLLEILAVILSNGVSFVLYSLYYIDQIDETEEVVKYKIEYDVS